MQGLKLPKSLTKAPKKPLPPRVLKQLVYDLILP